MKFVFTPGQDPPDPEPSLPTYPLTHTPQRVSRQPRADAHAHLYFHRLHTALNRMQYTVQTTLPRTRHPPTWIRSRVFRPEAFEIQL